MDLFVVNRHMDVDDSENPQNDDEQRKLQETLKKIQHKKKLLGKLEQTDKASKKAKHKTSEQEQVKPAQKRPVSHILDDSEKLQKNDIPETEPSVDSSVPDTSKEPRPKRKKQKQDSTNIDGFTILGIDNFNQKNKVKRVLPRWLANPSVVSVNLQNLESEVCNMKELDTNLHELLKRNGVTKFFPVQAEVIPWLLQSNKTRDLMLPRDVCVSAPTGSGKTLAFVLPVIQMLKKYSVKRIRAIAILPTQDLARQVFLAFKTYSEGTNIDVCLITGQNSFEVEQKQIVSKNEAFGFVTKVDILVCTAGRLVDHLKLTEGLDLSYLEFLIIDEADRVLETVQNDWLYHLEKHIIQDGPTRVVNQYSLQKHRPPQKLLFSATLSQDPEKLQQLSLFQPKLFTSIVASSDVSGLTEDLNTHTFVGKYTTPQELTEKYIETSADLKPLVLYKFIQQENLRRSLIFTHSVESAHRLVILLKAMFKNKLNIKDISSHLQSNARKELISQFSEGKIDLLISTDSLARGIDLPGVKCVISYSAPKYLKAYIHRVGRTARAGEKGLAVTFVHTSQVSKFKSMLNQAGKTNVEEIKISADDLETLGEQYKQSLEQLKKVVEKEDEVETKKIRLKKRANRNFNKKSKIKKSADNVNKQ